MNQRSRDDPYYASHNHHKRKTQNEALMRKVERVYSPYYLPDQADIHPEKQTFLEGTPDPAPMNFWWNAQPQLRHALVRRLGEGRSFDQAHSDHRLADGYWKGNNKGGGGKSGTSPRRRSKTHKSFDIRPY
eukprot:GHVT01025644.1.p2 GENE.GHVT01025644.1~~GHVT01025644.1.p2  ORF type:complete len:131 (-),score=13.50 GHVT01025644.1:483-875(-)